MAFNGRKSPPFRMNRDSPLLLKCHFNLLPEFRWNFRKLSGAAKKLTSFRTCGAPVSLNRTAEGASLHKWTDYTSNSQQLTRTKKHAKT